MTRRDSRLLLFIGISAFLHLLLLVGGGLSFSPSSESLAGGSHGVQIELDRFSFQSLGESGGAPTTGIQESAKMQGSGKGAGEGSGPGSGLSGTDPALAKILSQIERAKRYPYLAEKTGQTGRVLVRFSIDEQGEPANLEVARSSGHDLLDQEALATIRRAAPYPIYPRALPIWLNFLEKKG